MGRQPYGKYTVVDTVTGDIYTDISKQELCDMCNITPKSVQNYLDGKTYCRNRWLINEAGTITPDTFTINFTTEWDKVKAMFDKVKWVKRGIV